MGILKDIVDAVRKKKEAHKEPPTSEKDDKEIVNEWLRLYQESFQASDGTDEESE